MDWGTCEPPGPHWGLKGGVIIVFFCVCVCLLQTAMATGQVVYQRFYHCKSFVKHNMEVGVNFSYVMLSSISSILS